jgi:hypothetical protein
VTKLLEQIGLASASCRDLSARRLAVRAAIVADKRLEFGWRWAERKVVNRVWFGVPADARHVSPCSLFQLYSTVKWELWCGYFRNADFDPVRVMTAIREHMGEIIKVSVQVAVIGQPFSFSICCMPSV